MADKINPSSRVRSWHRRAFPVGTTGRIPLRAFARGLAKSVVSDAATEALAKIGTTPAQAKSVALSWCNDKRVQVSP
jgi:hypothetical protein